MDTYHTLAGALVIGILLLIGSALVFIFARAERALRALRSEDEGTRKNARRAAVSALGVAVVVALWLGLGSVSFREAFDRAPQAFVPRASVEFEPAGRTATTSFDRFDFGTATNAALARRG